MLRTPVVFLTGASGEIGHTLIERLSEDGSRPVITLDLKPLDPSIAPRVARHFTGSILEPQLLERILSEFEVDQVFHLAALLSTRSEFTPVTAHQVNVEGTMAMLEFAEKPRDIVIQDEAGKPLKAGDRGRRYFEGPWMHK